MLCVTVEEFEREERRQRRERGYELAASGLTAHQIAERLGVRIGTAQKWIERSGRCR